MKQTLHPLWTSKLLTIAVVSAIVTLAVTGFCGQAALAQMQQSDRIDPNSSASRMGVKTFATTCAGCHGLDGMGSERAPNIAGSAKTQHLSDSQLAGIISDGIPGTGMPPFHTLTDEKIREVVGYLRMLQGKGGTRTLPGDGSRGREIFFGKVGCSTCHAVNGAGGFLGPDLSAYGSAKSAKAILDGIVSRDRIVAPGYKLAIVATHNGDRFEGLVRNEDNFSLQLQTKDGNFHFFQKSELHNIERRDQSLMPANYRDTLSSAELDDLVNYLMSALATPSHGQSSDEPEETDVPH